MLRYAPYLAREAGYRLAAWSVRRLSLSVIETILSICGIWCLLTPLLLWVAWTQTIFFFLLGSAASACFIFCFVAIGASDREEMDGRPKAAMPPARRGSLPTSRDQA